MPVTLQTSVGPVDLLPNETRILDRLTSGDAPYEEGLAFYESVMARRHDFPVEWEIMILKATINAIPNRDDLVERLAMLEGSALAPEAGLTDVQTSVGSILLRSDEVQIVQLLTAGLATSEQGQALYSSLTARGLAFPPEWELLVVRTTLVALPNRSDLIMRLAYLEETVGPPGYPPAKTMDRLAFERAWLRFAHSRDLGSKDEATRRAARTETFAHLAQVLSSTVFEQQTAERQSDIIVAIHDTLMSAPSPDLFTAAELALPRVITLLEHPDLTEAQACRIYDSLHAMYFAGTSDVRDLRRFDTITPIFENWLRRRRGQTIPAPEPRPIGHPLTVVYFLHTAHFDRGNAVSPLIVSLAEAHARIPDRKVLLYAIQHVGTNFLDDMAGKKVTVRGFPQGSRYDRIDEIAQRLREDAADIVITEQNRAIAASLFVRRVARSQMWLDTGFPYWSLSSLDWTLSPAAQRGADLPPKTSAIIWGQGAETLKGIADPAEIARVRSSFPEGSFVLGVFVRLVKLNANNLSVLARMLAAYPRFHLVIAGPGDPAMAEAFARRPDLAGRVTLHAGMVDLDVYGPAIDLMCDTFPFIGGNACRQVSAHGTPVLARLGTPWDPLLKADRNPDLLAGSDEDYIGLAIRMAEDAGFRAEQRRVAIEKAVAYADPGPMLDDVEAAIAWSLEDTA